MFEMETKVSVPFACCEDCSLLEIKAEALYTDGKPFAMIMTCEHAMICENAIDLYKHSKRKKGRRYGEE